MEKEWLKNAEDMAIIETQLNDIRREYAKAVAALKNAERQVNREKQQAANMVTNIEREYGEKLARCEKQLKSVEKERNLLMVRIREDRNHVVRSQPATGRWNTGVDPPKSGYRWGGGGGVNRALSMVWGATVGQVHINHIHQYTGAKLVVTLSWIFGIVRVVEYHSWV